MLEISELIYETCKTDPVTQGKFIMLLWAFIAVIISLYFGVLPRLTHQSDCGHVAHHPACSRSSASPGSYGVAWFGIRVNTFANSRTAFAGLRGGQALCHL